MKTENGVTTYYIYGLGLIYETTDTDCKVYHYDYRGSTVALTNLQGSVTDTFTYDTYGKLTSKTGTTVTPFLYNGRDGVMTDENELVYMRARYYSPTFKRFINADVVAGSITNAITLNRYAYANGNPVSNVDPLGLSAERGSQGTPIGYGQINPFELSADRGVYPTSADENYTYFLISSIKPWGEPNSHVIDDSYSYLRERWYGPDGRAYKDRHHTDHSNPADHPYNPHDQYWDWSNPKHPKLKTKSYPPSEDTEEPADDSKNNENDITIDSGVAIGLGMIVFAGLTVIWIVGNDVTGIGVSDDVGLIPAVELLRQGANLICQGVAG